MSFYSVQLLLHYFCKILDYAWIFWFLDCSFMLIEKCLFYIGSWPAQRRSIILCPQLLYLVICNSTLDKSSGFHYMYFAERKLITGNRSINTEKRVMFKWWLSLAINAIIRVLVEHQVTLTSSWANCKRSRWVRNLSWHWSFGPEKRILQWKYVIVFGGTEIAMHTFHVIMSRIILEAEVYTNR